MMEIILGMLRTARHSPEIMRSSSYLMEHWGALGKGRPP